MGNRNCSQPGRSLQGPCWRQHPYVCETFWSYDCVTLGKAKWKVDPPSPKWRNKDKHWTLLWAEIMKTSSFGRKNSKCSQTWAQALKGSGHKMSTANVSPSAVSAEMMRQKPSKKRTSLALQKTMDSDFSYDLTPVTVRPWVLSSLGFLRCSESLYSNLCRHCEGETTRKPLDWWSLFEDSLWVLASRYVQSFLSCI